MQLRTCAGRYFGFLSCLVVLTLLGAPISDARAQDVQPGFDLFVTDPSNTQFDFSPQPIPADFFGPGSDPFDGIISLQGLPLPQNPHCPPPPTLCPNDDLSFIDTIVERIDPAPLPTLGSSATIDIEIVQLSLTSTQPITVTYNGGLNPELWDVDVCLSPTPSPTGQMTITKTHANGGTFDSQLPVTPLLIFTRQSDNAQQFLDGASAGLTDILEALGVPWEYENPHPLSCRSNFCTPDPFSEIGLLASHGLLPSCGQAPPVPALPRTGLIVTLAALAGVGVFVIRRFTRRASDGA